MEVNCSLIDEEYAEKLAHRSVATLYVHELEFVSGWHLEAGKCYNSRS